MVRVRFASIYLNFEFLLFKPPEDFKVFVESYFIEFEFLCSLNLKILFD